MPRLIALLAFATGALACVLPFWVLAFYSHPALDDFGISTVLANENIFAYTWKVYNTHSGRFSSSFFSFFERLLNDHLAWYPYLIFGFISAFVGSLCTAVAALMPTRGADKLLASSVLLIVGFGAFPWPAEGLFWLTGAQSYLMPLILGCWLLVGLAACYAAPAGQRQPGWWLLSGALGFAVAGFSEITALLLLLLNSAVWVLPGMRPTRREARWVGAVTGAGCLLMLAAPGNFHRLGHRAGSLHVLHSAALAAAGTAYLLVNWVGNALLLALTIVLLPVSQAVVRHPGRSLLNRLVAGPGWLWPLLLGVGLFGCVWFCYVVQGLGPALRVKNVLYFYFLLCWFLSVHAGVQRYAPPWPLRYPAAGVWRWSGGVGLLCLFFTDHNHSLVHAGIGQASNTVMQAYRDWLSGDAARYSAAQAARYQQLRTSRQDSVRLPELPVRPTTLFYADISYNPSLWGNQMYARFFRKQAVWVNPGPPVLPNAAVAPAP